MRIASNSSGVGSGFTSGFSGVSMASANTLSIQMARKYLGTKQCMIRITDDQKARVREIRDLRNRVNKTKITMAQTFRDLIDSGLERLKNV